MSTDINIINNIDYEELLQQAVAILENTRKAISRSIVGNVSNACCRCVNRLSVDLKQRYPTMGSRHINCGI